LRSPGRLSPVQYHAAGQPDPRDRARSKGLYIRRKSCFGLLSVSTMHVSISTLNLNHFK
jgi:hypothetical protein